MTATTNLADTSAITAPLLHRSHSTGYSSQVTPPPQYLLGFLDSIDSSDSNDEFGRYIDDSMQSTDITDIPDDDCNCTDTLDEHFDTEKFATTIYTDNIASPSTIETNDCDLQPIASQPSASFPVPPPASSLQLLVLPPAAQFFACSDTSTTATSCLYYWSPHQHLQVVTPTARVNSNSSIKLLTMYDAFRLNRKPWCGF